LRPKPQQAQQSHGAARAGKVLVIFYHLVYLINKKRILRLNHNKQPNKAGFRHLLPFSISNQQEEDTRATPGLDPPRLKPKRKGFNFNFKGLAARIPGRSHVDAKGKITKSFKREERMDCHFCGKMYDYSWQRKEHERAKVQDQPCQHDQDYHN